ncbi:transglycosylase domain-containing protein [Catalinimonas alkaloidigena]|uniref:transglycosylase domain-containing protein n=1 Tax=Catalinimonas alkaloidigena TaxID=1075417 RepID=UPI000B7F059A
MRFDVLYNQEGIGQAAYFYFQKEVEQLSPKEGLALIAMLRNPALYNPLRHLDRLERRIHLLESRLPSTSF